MFGGSGFNLGDIFATIKVKTDDLKKGIGEIEKMAKTAEHSNSRLGRIAQSIGEMGKRTLGFVVEAGKKAAFALTAVGAVALTFGVKSAAQFEQTRIGIENMLGSADKARALLRDISDFAAQTPFEFPELAQATRQLIAFGFSADDAFQTMKELGDVSAAIGAPINDLAYLMGTLKAQGRAFMIDIRQFAMRGIPIYEYLAKVFNTNTEEVQELITAGKVGFPEVQKAFQMMTAEGGAFHNTMARQSKSLSGLFSTLKDNMGFALREIIGINKEGEVRAGSLFDKLRYGISGLNDQLSNINWVEVVDNANKTLSEWANTIRDIGQKVFFYLEPSLRALWNTVNEDLMPVMLRLWNEVIKPLVPVIGTALVVALGLFIDAINALIAILSPLIKLMLDNKATVIALTLAYIGLKVAMNFNAIVAAFNAKMLSAAATMNAVRTGSLASLNKALMAFGGFGALAAAAVLAAALIIDAANKAKAAWQNAMNAADSAGTSNDAAIRKVKQAIKDGKISKERGAEIIRSFTNMASGGPVQAGRAYMVGENGREMFIPKTDGVIVPNYKGAGGGTVNIQGPINIGNQQDADYLLRRIDRNMQLEEMGMSPA